MFIIIDAIIAMLSFHMFNALIVSCTDRYTTSRDYHARMWLKPTEFCEYTTLLTFLVSLFVCMIPFINIVAIVIVFIIWLIDGEHKWLSKRPFKGFNK
jgi:hypothetical protein